MNDDKFLNEIKELEAKGKAIAEAKINWDDEPSSGDAWKMMNYRCDKCQHIEIIWNARPHVTPFGGVPCENCDGFMTHEAFNLDVYTPDHMPHKGDLIFIDTPPELALISAKRVLKRFAGEDCHPTPEQLALNNLSDFGGHPPSCIRLRS